MDNEQRNETMIMLHNVADDKLAPIEAVQYLFKEFENEEYFECDNEEIKQDVITGVQFWKVLFDRINQINTEFIELENGSLLGSSELLERVKNECIAYYVIDNIDSKYNESHFNVHQYLMKICIHQIWKLCYILSPRLRTNPMDAMYDIENPVDVGIQECRKLTKQLTHLSS
jgi:hypothetical protein